jgi:hypothetical protein
MMFLFLKRTESVQLGPKVDRTESDKSETAWMLLRAASSTADESWEWSARVGIQTDRQTL